MGNTLINLNMKSNRHATAQEDLLYRVGHAWTTRAAQFSNITITDEQGSGSMLYEAVINGFLKITNATTTPIDYVFYITKNGTQYSTGYMKEYFSSCPLYPWELNCKFIADANNNLIVALLMMDGHTGNPSGFLLADDYVYALSTGYLYNKAIVDATDFQRIGHAETIARQSVPESYKVFRSNVICIDEDSYEVLDILPYGVEHILSISTQDTSPIITVDDQKYIRIGNGLWIPIDDIENESVTL